MKNKVGIGFVPWSSHRRSEDIDGNDTVCVAGVVVVVSSDHATCIGMVDGFRNCHTVVVVVSCCCWSSSSFQCELLLL